MASNQMSLGERVAHDREQRGMTQIELSFKLASLRREHDYRKVKLSRRPTAIRAWLAKLESGKLRRDIPEAMRRLLAFALAADPIVYHSLSIQAILPDVSEPDRPAEFSFEELWVFTQTPFELRQPGYGRNVIPRWLGEDGVVDRPIVYFVPPDGTASELVAALRTSARGYKLGEEAMAANLRIEEVGGPAMAFIPHFVIRFLSQRGSREAAYDGFVEVIPHVLTEQIRWAKMPAYRVHQIVGLLERAGLLNADLRYLPGEVGEVRHGSGIEFKRFA